MCYRERGITKFDIRDLFKVADIWLFVRMIHVRIGTEIVFDKPRVILLHAPLQLSVMQKGDHDQPMLIDSPYPKFPGGFAYEGLQLPSIYAFRIVEVVRK